MLLRDGRSGRERGTGGFSYTTGYEGKGQLLVQDATRGREEGTAAAVDEEPGLRRYQGRYVERGLPAACVCAKIRKVKPGTGSYQ